MQNALSYVAVVCLGNLETITRTTKTLTWLEEWFMCLEFEHGHSLTHWKDLASASGCNINEKSCRKIIDNKLELALKCRNYWPMCASIDEDIKFRKDIWNIHFTQKTSMCRAS